jgi:iron complex transport system ATP-binding protein
LSSRAIELEQVSFGYGAADLFSRFDLSVNQGEFFGVIGPNGAGKSTLLRLCAGLLRPRSGRVRLLGKELGALRRREVARACGVVLQESFFAFDYSVTETVLMGRHPHLDALEQPGRHDRELARRALEFVDACGLQDKSINAISQGEKQRVLLARALCQEPSVLLLDEALSHLDLGHQQAMAQVLLRLSRAGRTVVLLSHDLNLTALFCDRLLLLDRGRAAACDAPERVLERELVARVYGLEPVVLAHPRTGRPQLLLPGQS